jgi:hypothetical protein
MKNINMDSLLVNTEERKYFSGNRMMNQKEKILGCLDGLLLEARYEIQELEKSGAQVSVIKGILDQIGAVKINIGHQTFVNWIPIQRGLPPMGVDVLVECDDGWMGIALVRQSIIPILDIDGNHTKETQYTTQWYMASDESIDSLEETVTRWAYLNNSSNNPLEENRMK